MKKQIYNTTAILIMTIGALTVGLFDSIIYVVAYLSKVDKLLWYILIVGNVLIAFSAYMMADFFMKKADRLDEINWTERERYLP